MEIKTKRESYLLYESGRFGNKLRTWNTQNGIKRAGYKGTVTIRYKGKGNQWCSYNVEQNKIESVIKTWIAQKAKRELITFNESAPDEHLVVQGELMNNLHYGYVFTYSTDKINMREAMKHPQEMLGRCVIDYLKRVCSVGSFLDIFQLLKDYRGAIIELSVYDTGLGNLPHRNAIIWEVRNY